MNKLIHQEYGFEYSTQVTQEIRDTIMMKRNFIRDNVTFVIKE